MFVYMRKTYLGKVLRIQMSIYSTLSSPILKVSRNVLFKLLAILRTSASPFLCSVANLV